MVKQGCSIGGNLNDSKFKDPMPWIGIYVAAASLACSIAMAADAFCGFRYRNFWFPSKFFSLNATSLTLLAIAVKLSVDLNTPMPHRQDQLAKLSSTVFMCTAIGNSMPSIGTMENKEIFMNITALGILVITIVVNICIQLATGAIYLFWEEHAFIMFTMLVLLVILFSSALTVPTTKHYFEVQYKKKHVSFLKEGSNEIDKSAAKKLKDDLTKYWMMAHTSCPQFVMGRSVTCTASGALCLLGAATFAEVMIRSYLMPWSFEFCTGESDYRWSTSLVLVTQTIAVGVGTIGPAFRWFIAVNFRCQKKGTKGYEEEFKLERYWTQRLVELKECPILVLTIHGQHLRKLAHNVKNQFFDFCIIMQTGIVIMSKLVCLISIFFMRQFLLCIHYGAELKRKIKSRNSISSTSNSISSTDSVSVSSQPVSNRDLSRFVLYLEGEEELVQLMTKDNCDATDHWIRMGRKEEPKYLIQLLEKSTPSQGLFEEVGEFDCDQVPSLDTEEPPNCWALPVVTLTSIAVALPNIDHCLKNCLMRSVNEGLIYVRLIEKILDPNADMTNINKTADTLWIGVELYHKWLDVDLPKMALEAKSPRETLEGLVSVAKNKFMESQKKHMIGWLKENPSKWPIKALAANSMYRISQTVLLDYENKNYQMGETLFEGLSLMISDIFGACFTGLQRVISMKCLHSTIEEREESIRHAVFVLGKTEKILKILDQKSLPGLNPDRIASIDEWRVLSKPKQTFSSIASSSDSGKTSSDSCDLHVSIE